MLDKIIQFSLRNRLLIICISLATLVVGSMVARSLPIDVLPPLTRPRVVLVTECNGMAPEEVERRVTFHLETSINGAPGVTAVRSSSDIGLSVVYVEFDWSSEIYTSRQIVQERIAAVMDQLPADIRPRMGPISSLLGQIAMVGMWSKDGDTPPIEVRTLADWTVRQRLLTIPGVSQVIAMGGGEKQMQVLVDPHKLHQYDVSLNQAETALRQSNLNVTGGYIEKGAQELLIRGLGRFASVEEIENAVVDGDGARPVLVRDIAVVRELPKPKRGDSTVNGKDAVVLTIQKQPNADTRHVTEEIRAALIELTDSLPADVVLEVTYEQREFIDHSVTNVAEALRDGAVLVAIVLFLFLFNFRTTLITLTAIPLSVFVTAIVFWRFGFSINVMTLGGLAVALGELVDDAIVDVENIYRRLRENRLSDNPRPMLKVIFDASVEVRNAIIISTVLVILVFAPLFALGGIEGRLFTPLGVAYVVSILASTLVSLTVTPVLSYYFLARVKITERERDGWVLRGLKWLAIPVIRLSMLPLAQGVILCSLLAICVAGTLLAIGMGKGFLPAFDEGASQVNLFAPPGTALETTRELSRIADQRLLKLVRTDEKPRNSLLWFTCRTGRAELDEHVMGVNASEYVITQNPLCGLTREQLIEVFHDAVSDIPGVEVEVEQPIAHLISHMLSGVTAQIAIKIFGDDLGTLRQQAEIVKASIQDIPGIATPVVEQQQITPQFRVELFQDRLAYYGVTAQFIHDFVETAMQGRVVSKFVDGQRTFDLVIRLAEPYREDLENLHRFPLELPNGERIALGAVARLYESGGPNTIKRENGRRRIVVRVNTRGRDLGSVVSDIESKLTNVKLPEGYFVVLAGQFEAQQEASRRIIWLSIVAIIGVMVVLYSAYPSLSLVLQILISLPAAFVGGVFALQITGQDMSVAAMVGFISLGGIAARNGLLLISTYLDRIKTEGFTKEAILGGSLERLAPVLMTALTTGLALVPLVIGGNQPGKEILFPVATVILGGLISATMCEFLIRPGLFWVFSRQAAERLTAASE